MEYFLAGKSYFSKLSLYMSPSFFFFTSKKVASSSSSSGTSYVTCHCGETTAIRVSTTSLNPGKRFFGCKNFDHPEKRNCAFFDWVENDTSVALKEREMYRQMNNMRITKEDLRVVKGLKALNT